LDYAESFKSLYVVVSWLASLYDAFVFVTMP
jgi:hypothetical protein